MKNGELCGRFCAGEGRSAVGRVTRPVPGVLGDAGGGLGCGGPNGGHVAGGVQVAEVAVDGSSPLEAAALQPSVFGGG